MGLVLTVREGESVYIGPDITITSTLVKGSQTHIHFDAPADVKIVRKTVVNKNPAAMPKYKIKVPEIDLKEYIESLNDNYKSFDMEVYIKNNSEELNNPSLSPQDRVNMMEFLHHLKDWKFNAIINAYDLPDTETDEEYNDLMKSYEVQVVVKKKKSS